MKTVDAVRLESKSIRPNDHIVTPRVLTPDQGGPERLDLLQDILGEVGKDGRMVPVRLEFTLHEGSGRLMVTVLDQLTGEVLRTTPPEQLLNILAKVADFIGLIVDERA